jgi:hypothetical protein
MTFCSKCGRELIPEAEFCMHCGTSVTSLSATPPKPTKKSHVVRNALVAAMLLLLIGSAALFFTQKPGSQTQIVTQLSPGKFVFVEHSTHIHGELIEGDYPRKMIDFPTYRFDQKTGILKGMIVFGINESLKAVFGSGLGLSGAAGGGASTVLSGVYKLPYEQEGLKIVSIDSDGKVHIEYKNESIVLKSGEEWVKTTSEIDVKEFRGQKGKAKLTTTDRIMNYGILDNSNLVKSWP